ncbi:NAD-dependent epimerase/dehydratase family protein [Ilumatobacter coccineus]|uniref:Putative UDP-hexose epimerase n=1 Tax=Ilumatobacter coccineus (strain NBRC 103263 / KCTC 29153 / YM16-304) TaxID=1313172 RepID=A0A6C7E4B5_ILUCY|nr:NAD-dependent epimerase/dehydratase family protein [Ilumatobacter coccineus]BAN01757.1 putative UDP-hexose epimerase [Ilumatobacter coccineus YM16-304]
MKTFDKVVLTGGAGLIGSHIADGLVRLQNDGACNEIVVFDNFTRGRLDNLDDARSIGDVTIVEGDVRDTNALKAAFDGADLVFHLAAIRITHCAEDPQLAHDVLGTGTFNVAQAAATANVDRVVLSSSASVYGMASQFPTTEDHHPYGNRTLYGALKTYNEGLFRSFNDMFGLDYLALRYFNVFGPRMDVHGKYTEVLIRWMDRIMNGEAPIIFGDGTQTMDFVDVRDIARANLLAAQSSISDEVYNVANGTETSLNDLARSLASVMGSDLTPEYGPERSVNPVPRRLAEVDRAADELGFRAAIDLESGLRDLVEWWTSVAEIDGDARR